MKERKEKKENIIASKTNLSLPTEVSLAREKSSPTRDIRNSVFMALLIFFAANNNLLESPASAVFKYRNNHYDVN